MADLNELRERLNRLPPGAGSADTAGKALIARLDALAQQPKTQEQPQEEGSLGEKLWSGLKAAGRGAIQGGMEFGQGATQLLSRTIPGQAGQRLQQDIQQQIQQGQQSFQQSPTRQASPGAAEAGRIAGQSAFPMALGAGMPMGGGLASRAGLGAVGGVLGGASQPVLSGDFWTEKGKQLAASGASGGLLGGLGGMIGPAMNPAMQKIQQAFPNLARMATGAEGRTVDNFIRATGNQVLEPIGQAIPRNIKVGHDLVNYVDGKSSEAYNNLLPKVTFHADPEFVGALSDIKNAVEGTSYADRMAVKLKDIGKALGDKGTMSGQAFKKLDSELGKEAAANSIRTANPDHLGYATALRSLQADMRDALKRTNPEQRIALQNADDTWAMNLRLQDAAGRDIRERGQFSPTDLLYAIRNGGGAAKRQFAKGDRLMQGFAEAGDDMLSMRPPGMDKMQKLVADLGGMAVGGAMGHAAAGPYGGIGGAMAGHFGRGAVGAVTDPMISGAFRAAGTPQARAIGQGVSRAAPTAGAAAARRVDTLTEDPHVSVTGP